RPPSACFSHCTAGPRDPPSFPTRRSSDLHSARLVERKRNMPQWVLLAVLSALFAAFVPIFGKRGLVGLDATTATALRAVVMAARSEEHTSELQSRENLVCRLLLEKKKG